MSLVFSEETHRNLLSRIPQCTGREISDWLRTVDDGPALVRFDEKVAWLRGEYDGGDGADLDHGGERDDGRVVHGDVHQSLGDL
ncbi:DUF4287 domain-containing protein, partial [Streptomyces niveus]|uniref:DUF4287 domain-containing protein n=1 Tax=Streptomyces niveus TaxID=193462 RepID=UPI003F4DCFCB